MRLFITSAMLAVIVFSGACGGGDGDTTNTPAASAPTTVATTAPTSAPAPDIPYDIVETWNEGQGQAIVISPDNVNDEDLTALGEQLNSTMETEDFAFIFVFDDREAAALRQKVFDDTVSEAELAIYQEHFVGRYGENDATGFAEFRYHLDSVGGRQQKTIEY